MNLRIIPRKMQGKIHAPASKSYLHRYIIAAALSDRPCSLCFADISDDIKATLLSVEALGAKFQIKNRSLFIIPCDKNSLAQIIKDKKRLNFFVNESGSTYRFFIAISAILGINAYFYIQGSLKTRPMDPIFNLLKKHEFQLEIRDEYIHINGKLKNGSYEIDGNISSQFISGMLLATACDNRSWSIIPQYEGEILPSKPYIDMTIDVLQNFNVKIETKNHYYHKAESCTYKTLKETYDIEGDWSNSAFWLCLADIQNSDIKILGLNRNSLQGDKIISDIIKEHLYRVNRLPVVKGLNIDISNIPDLIPVLAILAVFSKDTSKFYPIERLKFKESNRIKSVCEVLEAIDVKTRIQDNYLEIFPNPKYDSLHFNRDTIDSYKDHRIVMMTAILSCLLHSEITIKDADSVNKSYPGFWKDLCLLGCKIEKGEEK